MLCRCVYHPTEMTNQWVYQENHPKNIKFRCCREDKSYPAINFFKTKLSSYKSIMHYRDIKVVYLSENSRKKKTFSDYWCVLKQVNIVYFRLPSQKQIHTDELIHHVFGVAVMFLTCNFLFDISLLITQKCYLLVEGELNWFALKITSHIMYSIL